MMRLSSPKALLDKWRIQQEQSRERARNEAKWREKRTIILQTLQTYLPAQEDMKARQELVDTITDELMELLGPEV